MAKIFISYSLKSPVPEDVKKIIDTIKERISRKGLIVLDPMAEGGAGSVSDKVMSALFEADAIFAEITMGIPNVLFEVGFGRALGCPIVTFVDSSSANAENVEWNVYLDLIKQDKSRPLPTDLGDLEYFSYSSDDIRAPNRRGDLRLRIDRVLDYLKDTTLSPGACILRQNHRRLLSLTQKWVTTYSDDHPIIRHIGGWYGKIAEDFEREGITAFEIDSQYYSACLSSFHGYKGAANAIADLVDVTEEGLWEENPDPLRTAVSERLFLIDWKTFSVKTKLDPIIKMLVNQRKKYPVRVGVVPPVVRPKSHPLGGRGVGQHLLLMEPDLVGGYVLNKNREFLRIESNPQLYREASAQYAQKRDEQTIEFQQNWTWLDFRKHWMSKAKIGHWNPLWGPVADRDEHYFNNYDMHIRCWIPSYDLLIADCLARIQSNIVELLHGKTNSLKILELGYGTGALTEPLLEWIAHLNEPFRKLRKPLPVELYLGIDTASQMKDILIDRIKDRYDGFSRFEIGTAWNDFDLPIVKSNQPFDIICGSLVLHDILESPHGVKDLFDYCSHILKPGGRAVFADSFGSTDSSKQQHQINVWTKWMMENGLEKTHVDNFIKDNQEMINMPNEQQLSEYSTPHGYSLEFHPLCLPGKRRTPFAVMGMIRTGLPSRE